MEGHHPMELAAVDEGFTPIVAKFSRFAHELYQHARYKRLRTNLDVPEVYIRIGPPGTGKSRWLDEQYGLDKWIEAPDNTGKWFDGCELTLYPRFFIDITNFLKLPNHFSFNLCSDSVHTVHRL